MFKPGDRIWPAGNSFRREYPDRVLAVNGNQIYVAIYPDGLTYNLTPVARGIGWREAQDYVLAEGYVPTRNAYGYVPNDILGRDRV